MHRLKEKYRDEIVPRMMEEFGYTSVMQVPRVEKITVNVGLGEALQNANAIEAATRDITKITGQRPIVTRARKSIANFKLREGNPIGVMVTLRQDRMYSFLDRLINIALPRQRDFRGFRVVRSTGGATIRWDSASSWCSWRLTMTRSTRCVACRSAL